MSHYLFFRLLPPKSVVKLAQFAPAADDPMTDSQAYMPGNRNEFEKRLWDAGDELRAKSKRGCGASFYFVGETR